MAGLSPGLFSSGQSPMGMQNAQYGYGQGSYGLPQGYMGSIYGGTQNGGGDPMNLARLFMGGGMSQGVPSSGLQGGGMSNPWLAQLLGRGLFGHLGGGQLPGGTGMQTGPVQGAPPQGLASGQGQTTVGGVGMQANPIQAAPPQAPNTLPFLQSMGNGI
jgi:hypothetical protein